MCMKYVNANVQCFSSAGPSYFSLLKQPLCCESVKAKEVNGKYIIGNFDIVTFVNIRGTTAGNNKDNPLDAKEKLEFKIRLTKLDPDPEKQLSYDLGEFTMDLSDKSNVRTACFKYVERIESLSVDNVALESKGDYVIKILVKKSGDPLYNIQITHPLQVK